jgi:hypothetical protein
MIRVDILIIVASLFAVGLFVLSFTKTEADSNRGCIASAYQATHHGFDLGSNLTECR